MLWYIATRLAQAFAVIAVVSLVVFALIRIIPGDPAVTLAGPDATPEAIEAIRSGLGLDKPVFEQYWRWLGGVLTGDLGLSYYFQRPVTDLVATAFPITLRLGITSMVLAAILGILLGIASSAAKHRWVRNLAEGFTTAAYAVPNFVLGLLLIIVFAVWLRALPPGGWVPITPDPGLSIRLMILPVLALALPLAGVIARFQHASMDETLREEYMLTSRAKGTPRWRLLGIDAQRNAAIPVLTILGIQFGHVLGGAVVVETVFSIPGLGRLLLQAVLNRDYPTVQGVLLLLAAIFVVVNLIVDLLYGVIDPRVRRTGARP